MAGYQLIRYHEGLARTGRLVKEDLMMKDWLRGFLEALKHKEKLE
jgi:hypothetical protein